MDMNHNPSDMDEMAMTFTIAQWKLIRDALADVAADLQEDLDADDDSDITAYVNDIDDALAARGWVD